MSIENGTDAATKSSASELLSKPASSGSDLSDSGESGTFQEPQRRTSGRLISERAKKLNERITEHMTEGRRFYSLEFFPPRTASGAANLYAKFENLGKGNPMFATVTWHPAGDPESLEKPTSSTMIAGTMLNYSGLETVLHMSCLGYSRAQLRQNLQNARKLGIQNLIALRGDRSPNDPGDQERRSELKYASDFVRFIRAEFGDQFVIAVAGYPCGHPEAASYEEDLMHLKEKVDAGADLIISQLFFKVEQFLRFYADCRALGIKVPILPGLFPIQGYASLRSITKISSLNVPEEITRAVEPIKNNDEAIRNLGVHLSTEMCIELNKHGHYGLHFYTLNREIAVLQILDRLGMIELPPPMPGLETSAQACCANTRPLLPWKRSGNAQRRAKEEIRPIFWGPRPNAYIYRTSHWDEFPNGRWGNSASAAFGELKDYYLFYLSLKPSLTPEQLKEQWLQELTDVRDITHVICSFLSGIPNRDGHIVRMLPWSDQAPAPETNIILSDLVRLNERHFWTINSQPAVDGVRADHPIFGWGPSSRGYIYQKCYLEFFMPRTYVPALEQALERDPRYKERVNYAIVSADGSINITNYGDTSIAVTWGVFPGREIIQPTIADPNAFQIWKTEAFDLWSKEWARIYQKDSASYKLLSSVVSTHVLVNLVDNDYRSACCLFRMLEDLAFDLADQPLLNGDTEHLNGGPHHHETNGCSSKPIAPDALRNS